VGGALNSPGNVLNLQSWDGFELGTQWRITCPVIYDAVLMEDSRVNGTGILFYRWVFLFSGTLWLSKNGPWGENMTEDLSYPIQSFIGTHDQLYVNGEMIGAVTDFNLTIFGYGDPLGPPAVQMTLSNCVYCFGHCDSTTEHDYPEFLDENCVEGVVSAGEWAEIDDITLIIDRPLPLQLSTWGRIKALYQ
jgi:hypothetical protein